MTKKKYPARRFIQNTQINSKRAIARTNPKADVHDSNQATLFLSIQEHEDLLKKKDEALRLAKKALENQINMLETATSWLYFHGEESMQLNNCTTNLEYHSEKGRKQLAEIAKIEEL